MNDFILLKLMGWRTSTRLPCDLVSFLVTITDPVRAHLYTQQTIVPVHNGMSHIWTLLHWLTVIQEVVRVDE